MKYIKTINGIEVEITKKSNIKNIYLRVLANTDTLKVSAPIFCSEENILSFIMQKLPQIYKAKEKLKNNNSIENYKYLSNEKHYLWGKAYILDIIYVDKNYQAEKTNDKIILKIPHNSNLNVRKAFLQEFYRQELKDLLPKIIKKCEKITNLSANEYRIKNMQTKWGTCNIHEKRIWLNLQLAKKPIECLEYVLIHELVHLLEKNHTKRFFDILESFCPSWQELRRVLNANE